MYDYESLKELATTIRKDHKIKCRVSDLFALAPANDPFYMGTDTDKENGKWFADLWERFGYMDATGIHLRRVHYQIISQKEPVLMPNGKPYQNTEGCWNFLTMASKCARYLEYVNAESFVDRRNPDPRIFATWENHDPDIEVRLNLSWDSFELPRFPDMPNYRITDKIDPWTFEPYTGQQRYQLEIWCEKSTMNDVLIPLCQQYHVNLVTGVGEQSITSTIDLVKRANEHQKPVRVFYVSDFDPAGKSMPVSVSRKAEYYINKLCPDIDFRLFPVVLTEQQVRQYHLPRTPIKDSERRKDHFEEVYGTGAVELDALQALYPGTLREILTDCITHYYDTGLASRVNAEKNRLQRNMNEVCRDVMTAYQDEIDVLRSEYSTIREEFQERLADIQERIESKWYAIQKRLEEEKPNIEDYPIPEPEENEELGSGLYNSQRSYEEQLLTYKDFQGKGNGNFAHLADVLLTQN